MQKIRDPLTIVQKTDGTIKKCLRDTVYSPDEYAADWEQVSTS